MNKPYSEWTEEQKERNRRNSRRYKRDNREKVNAANRRWRADNPEYVQEYNRLHYKMFRGVRLAYGRRRYWQNRERILAQQRQHYAILRSEAQRDLYRIMARMNRIERDAVAIFDPSKERQGILPREKRPDRRSRGKSPAETVALRLATRKGE